MIIKIDTTDPVDSGPVNLHSRWDIMDWGRLTQRAFINTTISGYWEVDNTGLMKKIPATNKSSLDISFMLDMRRMNTGLLYAMYQKLQKINHRQKIYWRIADKKSPTIITLSKDMFLVQKNTPIALLQLK